MVEQTDTAGGEESSSGENSGISFNLAQIWTHLTSFNESEGTTDNDTPKSPVVILGSTYSDVESSQNDIQAKIWLTYRFGFEPIPRSSNGPNPLSFLGSVLFSKNLIFRGNHNLGELIDSNNFTTDVGWGCMIRTSQSLLANTYLRLLQDDKKIIDMFQDLAACPYSLHNFVAIAGELPLKVQPGEWFGPNAASLSISRLCQRHEDNSDLPRINVLISENGDLYDYNVLSKFHDDIAGLLVLLPVRLGIDQINTYYHDSLLHFLSLKQSVGIAGGKPSSSFYFFGYQDHDLFYLDPHFSQIHESTANYETYHTSNYQKLPICNLDPSMMIGVLLTDPQDYYDFKKLCIDTGNKIVHFHELKNERKRRSSEFVTINEEDVRDEFVDIKYDKIVEDEEFVDLGPEADDEEVIVETPEEQPLTADSYEAINNDSQYQENDSQDQENDSQFQEESSSSS